MRQPHSTTERQRQKALGRGEYLMQGHAHPELDQHGMNYHHQLQQQNSHENHNHSFESHQPEMTGQMMQRYFRLIKKNSFTHKVG